MFAMDAMMDMNLTNIALLTIKSANYCCIISGISKSETINVLQNIDLIEKKWNILNYKNLSSHMKMVKEISTFDDLETEKKNFFTVIRALSFQRCSY